MDEILANKIAAGEVVERCASVVKELVENSIDAGAREIKIELIDAGTKEIKVTDDGKGMEKEDAVTAFARHATSKIHDEDDLYRIETLGFRGEALASIASVSDVTLKTSMGSVGTFVHFIGGKKLEVESSDARVGTVMTVRDLFYNTPARLKHMKSLYTELASITEYINRLSLSHPEIRFYLSNNNNVLLNTDGSNQLLKTIKNIYGVEVAKKMIEVKADNDDYQIEGYISLPEIHRSSRNHMVTLVNNRVVRNMDLNRVINDSYHSYKPDNRYPIVVLSILVDPSLIDVNIHPTKMDIKFSKMDELLLLIEQMIKAKLSHKTLIPEVEIDKKNVEVKKPQYVEQFFELRRVKEEEIPYETPIIPNSDLIISDLSQSEEKLEETPDVETPQKRLPELYPVGLVHGTYIICQNELGMYLIDQHAAKERINYEKFKYELGHPNHNHIAMLFPLTMELSNSEFVILKENFDVLQNIGFEIEEFGINSIVIKTHPTWLPRGYEDQAIRKIIEMVTQIEKNFDIEKFNERTATMLACKLAIKANMNITQEEMEQLIHDLRNCANPFNCPHGRPTIIFYSNYDLEKLFKRSGFEMTK